MAGEPGRRSRREEAHRPRRLARALGGMLVLLAAAGLAGGLWLARRHARSPAQKLIQGNAQERVWAVQHLVEAGPNERAWESIAEAVDDPDTAVRLAAVGALGRSERKEYGPRLAALLAAAEPLPVRLRAIEALARIGGEEAWRAVVLCLADARPEMRGLAALCVGRYGRREARAALAPLLHDPFDSVRERAEQAMEDLAGPVTEKASPAPSDGRLVFEAERGCRFRGNFEIGPSPRELASLSDIAKADPCFAGLEGFSGAGWIHALEGAGGNHDWLGGESGSIDIGRVDYPLPVAREGDYRLWARAWFMDKCGNSFHSWFDSEPVRNFRGEGEDHDYAEYYRVWHWYPDRQPVRLTAGVHALHIQVREDGVRFDQFCLVPEGSPAPPDVPLRPNFDPLSLASDGAEVAIARETETIDSRGILRAAVRVLRGGGGDFDGTLELDAEDGAFGCPRKIPVLLSGVDRVFVQDLTLTFAPGSPCRERLLTARFVSSEGRAAKEARRVVTKPWPWQVAGPFPQQRDAKALASDPAVTWRSFPAERLFDRYQRMDFEKVFGNGASGWIYLRARVRSPKAGKSLWLLNSDDSSAVWLDGVPAIANPRCAPAEGFLTREWKDVAAGEHQIAAECFNSDVPDGHIYLGTQNYWLFRLRVRADEHKPADIEGVPWK